MIVGIDEVGMGPLAGPVVVAAALIADGVVEGVRDSKLVAESKRYALAEELQEKAEWFQIAQRSSDDINDRGLFPCVYECIFELADTARQKYPTSRIIIDGQPSQLHTKKKRPWLEFQVGGDSTVYQIGAASLIAKAHRDLQMIELGKEFPLYGFERHKGYPTKAHIEALKAHGATAHHRRKATNRTLSHRLFESSGDHRAREEETYSIEQAQKYINQVSGMFDVLDDWSKGFVKSMRGSLELNLDLTPRQKFFLKRMVEKAKKKKSKKEKARLKRS
jgi:ribonuclease HII